MQRDKAALAYHGQPQLAWAYDLVSQVCAATFVSVRPEQRDEPTRREFPQIVDRQPGTGPIAGISAALQEHPKVAWLVIACDLPFLTRETLQHLIAQRNPDRIATAYRSAHDALPEPLCAIWEPQAREALLAYIASGKQCPRKLLINSNALLLDLPDARALDNVNTAQEFAAASEVLTGDGRQATGDSQSSSSRPSLVGKALEGRPLSVPSRSQSPVASSPTIRVHIHYYALFREQAGCSEETADTAAATPAELYSELQARHPFSLARDQLKVAINTDFRDWNAPLMNGDTIVFIPPVAGG